MISTAINKLSEMSVKKVKKRESVITGVVDHTRLVKMLTYIEIFVTLHRYHLSSLIFDYKKLFQRVVFNWGRFSCERLT